MRKQDQQEHDCMFCRSQLKYVKAVRLICYDSNFYENDKYAWACEEHLKHEVSE